MSYRNVQAVNRSNELKTDKRRLSFITSAYGIGATLVVFGHSHPLGNDAFANHALAFYINNFVCKFHMPLFFFIAGFLLIYGNSVQKRGYGKFLEQKAMKLLIPYFVLSLIFIVPKFFLSKTGYISDETNGGFMYIVTAIFSPRDNVWGHFWFIPTLFSLYVIGGLLTFGFENPIVRIISLIASIFICIFQIKCTWFSIKDICWFLFYFVFGMVSVDFVLKYNSYMKKPLIIVIELVIGVLLFCFGNIIKNEYVASIIDIMISVTMISCVFGISMNVTRIFDTIGRYVFPIFIMGWPIQSAVEVVFNKILHLNWYVTTITMFISGFVPILIVFVYKRTKLRCKFLDYILGVA